MVIKTPTDFASSVFAEFIKTIPDSAFPLPPSMSADLAHYGFYITMGGKRIDPADYFNKPE